MAAPYHTPCRKLDVALCAYLSGVAGAGSLENIFPGKNSLGKDSPCTKVVSQDGPQTPPYSGNFEITARVSVVSAAGVDAGQKSTDPATGSDARVGATCDALAVGGSLDDGLTVARLINEAAYALASAKPVEYGFLNDFTAQNVIVTRVGQGFNGDQWEDWVELVVLCCPSAVNLS